MITFDCFPGGKKYCVTFSFDDGPSEDARLVKLFDKYGLRGTFNICDGCLDRLGSDGLKEVYGTHEIACHGRKHLSVDTISDATLINEIFGQRKLLESALGQPVCGMAYPCARFNDSSIETLKKCGIVYSRTGAGGNFNIPSDFMRWNPTCHFKQGAEYAERLFKMMDGYFAGPRIMYVWGHAFELRTEEDWEMMEQLCKTISNDERIWYATNMEIYRYMQAVYSLVISADETIVHNPSATDVWIAYHRKPVKIPAGQTIKL